MIDWPEDLVLDIARRRAVLFLGAGVSRNATNALGERPLGWDDFLKRAAEKIKDADDRKVVDECLKEGDLLTACELVREVLGHDFNSHLLREYSGKQFRPGAIHDDLVALDSRIVLTTNVDRLYEGHANTVRGNSIITKNYYDDGIADILRRPERLVLKVHGTIDTPGRTIFTRVDYARARTQFSQFYRLLESLFLTHTFIFLGASMRDPDIRLVLEDLTYRYTDSRPHYMITPAQELHARVIGIMQKSMSIHAIDYAPADHHIELARSLNGLNRLVQVERERLQNTLEW